MKPRDFRAYVEITVKAENEDDVEEMIEKIMDASEAHCDIHFTYGIGEVEDSADD